MNIGSILLLVLALIGGGWDLATRRIPNWLTFPAMLAGLIWNVAHAGWPGLADAAAGLALGATILLPFFLLGGTGAGDVKMLAAAGAITGWLALIKVFLYFGILGGIVALAMAIAYSRVGALLRSTITHFSGLLAPARWHRPAPIPSVAPPLPYGAVIGAGCLLFLLLG
jgi:prepilin peptidase CpaA